MADGVVIKTDNRTVLAGLDETRIALGDVPLMLHDVAGDLMRASVARTFRDEGSPAGSWPKLAASTLKKKGYTSGHKLLIMSGRLFGSITYVVSGNTLTIGTSVAYAAAQQFGSNATVHVAAHQGARASFNRKGKGVDAAGHTRAMRYRGPANRTTFQVGAHDRKQNIPARPFLVFRPEDPQRIMEGFEAYLAGKLVRVGKVISTRNSAGLQVNIQGVTG